MQSQTAKFFHEHTLVKPAGGSTVTPGIMTSLTIASPAGRTSASGSRWTRWRRPPRCVAFAGRIAGRRSSVLPVSMALSFTSTPGSAPCRISTPMRTNTISSAGRWSRGCGGLPFPHRPWRPRQPGARARRVFSARWVGDDAAFADRGGVTSPPFPELTLRDGDPLDSPAVPPGLAAGVSHWRRDLL